MNGRNPFRWSFFSRIRHASQAKCAVGRLLDDSSRRLNFENKGKGTVVLLKPEKPKLVVQDLSNEFHHWMENRLFGLSCGFSGPIAARQSCGKRGFPAHPRAKTNTSCGDFHWEKFPKVASRARDCALSGAATKSSKPLRGARL